MKSLEQDCKRAKVLLKTEMLLNTVETYNKAAKLARAGFRPDQIERWLKASLNR